MGTSREYYIYAYLREDKTPYYIGKGKGNTKLSKECPGENWVVGRGKSIKIS